MRVVSRIFASWNQLEWWLRQFEGLSQSQLAKRMKNPSPTSLASRVARCARRPTPWSASRRRLARVYGSSSNRSLPGDWRKAGQCFRNGPWQLACLTAVSLTFLAGLAKRLPPRVGTCSIFGGRLSGSWRPSVSVISATGIRHRRQPESICSSRQAAMFPTTNRSYWPQHRHRGLGKRRWG